MHKIRRKPPPAVDPGVELDVALDVRYPTPDPNDPFAPLWVLRSRNSTNDLRKVCAQSTIPAVAFPIIHDHISTASDSSNTTNTSHHTKWHSRLLRRVRASPSPLPSSSSTSTSSSFVHVSVPSPYDDLSATEWTLPTPAQLARAASLPVIAASGLRVPFASLFAKRQTIVVFIRNFWCPHCQDYVSSISQTALRPSEKQPVDLVVIGNGAPAFIPKYRALFGLDFEIYTDPTLAVYTELGMRHSSASGDYAVGSIAKVVLRTLKAGLPVWEHGGDIHQLGGEFVFGPGLTCTYAHRMQSPKGHAPIHAVLTAAGVDVPPSPVTATTTPPKLLSSLRIKSWTPQKRSRSLTPNGSQPKTEPNCRKNKNMSIGTHPILGSPTMTHAASASMSPITEFGVWRRAGRVSFDSTRVLSDGVRHSCSFPSPYQRHRLHASTSALPLCSPGGQGEEEAAWSPCELLPPGDDDAWVRVRMASLEAIRERKRERRAGVVGYCVPRSRVDSASVSPERGGAPATWEPLDEAEETEEEG